MSFSLKYSTKTLPKWAQQRIEQLEMRLAEAKAKLRTMAGTPDTFVAVNEGPWEESGALFWAPDDASVKFFFGGLPDQSGKSPPRRYRWIEVRLNRDNQSGRIVGSQCLAARFSAGNVVTMGVEG